MRGAPPRRGINSSAGSLWSRRRCFFRVVHRSIRPAAPHATCRTLYIPGISSGMSPGQAGYERGSNRSSERRGGQGPGYRPAVRKLSPSTPGPKRRNRCRGRALRWVIPVIPALYIYINHLSKYHDGRVLRGPPERVITRLPAWRPSPIMALPESCRPHSLRRPGS